MRFLITIIQLTWGLAQSLLGFLLFLVNIKHKHYWYRNCIVTEWASGNGCSLGLFVFVENGLRFKDNIIKHEYGHCIQSLILGPLYLLVIGLPSFMWCNVPYFETWRGKRRISYYSFYPERWANLLADKYIREN